MTVTNSVQQIFESAPTNPPDPIFGLIEQFKLDPNPNKINLSVGVYQDESGQTPVMKCVRAAEEKMLASGLSKSYLPIDGSVEFNQRVGRLVFGDELSEDPEVYGVTAQTPGGTVSLRVAGELLRRVFDVDTVWMSAPTWANHPKIFQSAGLKVEKYDYLDDQRTRLDFSKMKSSLEKAQPGQAVLLHTVCHNPTGVDPTIEQWNELSDLIMQQRLFPIFDFAYQGFGVDLEEDAFPIRNLARKGELIACNSFSKNFGLYGERVGGISAISRSSETAAAMLSQIKLTIRTMYSNPPIHGGLIVATVLEDAELTRQWQVELKEIRERIQQLRALFVQKMSSLVPTRDWEYINQQRGMFSYSGLTEEQVNRLRTEHAIYALGSGRINIAGINQGNLDRLCEAIASVLN